MTCVESSLPFLIEMIPWFLFQPSEGERFALIWFMIYFPLVAGMLFLHFFSDTPIECDVPKPMIDFTYENNP